MKFTNPYKKLYLNFLKNILDKILALIGFIFVLPVFIILIVVFGIINRGNVFFIQERTGKNGKIFKLIKFKTMNDRLDKEGNLMPDAERLSAFGKIARKTSLDELPQLMNVINGDMSLVGPRPLLPEYLPLYNNVQERRHEVKPGITGWAQVNGRNDISWQEKFAMDVWYVDNLSFLLDIRIMLKTVWNVLNGKGINKSGHVTTEKFNGNN